jgi:hypothetical protein
VPQLRNGSGSQRPQFQQPANEIVIVPQVQAAPANNVTITFGNALHGQQVELQEASFKHLMFHTASDQPWPLSLMPGVYVLVIGGNERTLIIKAREVKTKHYDN